MSDASAPSAMASGVAARFVSSAALDEAKKKREEEWKAAYERIGQEPPKQVEDNEPYDGRSLWEKLQENKNKKQEAFEEQLKFKNQFRALDEDEIDFLDTMIEENNEEEVARKKAELEEMKGFRAAVTKRAAPPAPPAVSPPLASTSASSAPTPAAPKPAAAPKKGKKKSLPGLVVGKKKEKPSAAAPAKSASPAAAAPSAPVTASAPVAGTKRAASPVTASAESKDLEGGSAKEVEGGGEAVAKKRRVADEASS
ncbi:hypothetical protein JCM10213_006583 [Rhodosporidiobolus nylandii]